MIAITPILYSPLARFKKSDEFMEKACTDPHLFASFLTLMRPFVNDASAMGDGGIRGCQTISKIMSKVQKSDKPGIDQALNGSSPESMKILSEFRKTVGGSETTALYFSEFMLALDVFGKISVPDRTSLISSICDTIEHLAESENFSRTSGAGSHMAVDENMIELCQLLNCTEGELDLLRISFMNAVEPAFSIFYRMLQQSVGRTDQMSKISELLVGEDALDKYESTLLKFGICHFNEYGQTFLPLSEWWVNALSNNETFMDQFITPIDLKKTRSSGSMARLGDKDADRINSLIRKHNDQSGVNVVCYGAKTLDLLGAVIAMFEDKEIIEASGHVFADIYEINRHARNEDMPGIVAVAQAFLDYDEILIVDKAHTALARGYRKQPGWLAEIMEISDKKDTSVSKSSDEILLSTNKPTTVWITNKIDSISIDGVSRFLLHAEIRPASRDAKQKAIAKLTANLDLSSEAKQKLLNYAEIDVEQLNSAVKATDILEAKGDDEQFLSIIDASQKALSRDIIEEVRPSVTKYDLDLLNLQGKYGPEKIIQALKRNGEGTLCFYGMPGTGKTQLAEYIALQLNKPLLVKRASDILSKYLGESEQNIAAMFSEAKSQGAVLLLDEADSFLRDRSYAKNSWEITQVNELLQGMERHRGVFICATNLFEQFDMAAIRRFTFKLRFRELDVEQRMKMFTNETGTVMNHEHALYTDLLSINHLTPGDFAAVQRQAKLFGETFTPQEWIDNLRAEAASKAGGMSRQRNGQQEIM